MKQHDREAASIGSTQQHHAGVAALPDPMTRRDRGAALVGSMKQHHVGGPALIVFGIVLWALFLGTVGRPLDAAVQTTPAVSSFD